MLRNITVPVLLLHGDKDRLVPIAAARAAAAANQHWRFAVAHGVGHVPQLEVPDWTLDQILDWLATDAAAAADLAGEASTG
jgi:pimeloyl-ACP methyl ester carboxylesterase